MSVNKNVIFKDFNLTPRAKKAYSDAHSISKELGHANINNLHVFYGCIKNSSSNFQTELFLRQKIKTLLFKKIENKLRIKNKKNIGITEIFFG